MNGFPTVMKRSPPDADRIALPQDLRQPKRAPPLRERDHRQRSDESSEHLPALAPNRAIHRHEPSTNAPALATPEIRRSRSPQVRRRSDRLTAVQSSWPAIREHSTTRSPGAGEQDPKHDRALPIIKIGRALTCT